MSEGSPLSNIHKDIKRIKKSIKLLDTKKRLENLVKSPSRKLLQDQIKSLEVKDGMKSCFSLPKISRLNQQIDRTEMEASRLAITIRRKDGEITKRITGFDNLIPREDSILDKEKKVRKSYGPIYKNLFDPKNK
jgi:hypothetical protein